MRLISDAHQPARSFASSSVPLWIIAVCLILLTAAGLTWIAFQVIVM